MDKRISYTTLISRGGFDRAPYLILCNCYVCVYVRACAYVSELQICTLYSLTTCSHADGRLHILTSLRDIYSFPAYLLRVNFIYQFKTRNIFLTVGDDEDMTPLIRSLFSLSLSLFAPPPPLHAYTVLLMLLCCLYRVWNMDKRNKDGSPTLARTIRAIIPGAKQQCPVSVTLIVFSLRVHTCSCMYVPKLGL